MSDSRIVYFGETDARNKRVPFGIKSDDRLRHLYVIGKTGMGKSTILENMAVQDMKNGEGLAFLDPHGKTAELLLDYVPAERVNDVVYFAPFDTDYPVSLNVLESVDADKRHLVVSGLMSAFKKIWVDAWSARMEYILTNALLALLEYPGATLLGVNRMFADKVYQKKVVASITDVSVKTYWTEEYARYSEKYIQEAIPPIQNKIGQFTGNPIIRNIIGQPTSSFDIRKAMDEKKILIINLSKGRLGEANANLLGSMFITKLYLAAMSRADLGEAKLKHKPNFYMYVDEFQSFANESFADILSEARKYKLSLAIAHQYIEQMSDEVRAAVFGNIGTMISFRVGAYDAEVLEKEFSPVFTATDMVSLGKYQAYLKLMIDGVTSHPFSARTLPPIAKPEVSMTEQVIESSRRLYARPRAEVESAIKEWYGPGTGGAPAATKESRGAVFTPAAPPAVRVSPSREAPESVRSIPSSSPAPSPTAPAVSAQETAPIRAKEAIPPVLEIKEVASPAPAPASLPATESSPRVSRGEFPRAPRPPHVASAPAAFRPGPSDGGRAPFQSESKKGAPFVRSPRADDHMRRETYRSELALRPAPPAPIPATPRTGASPSASFSRPVPLSALKQPPMKGLSSDPRAEFTENRKTLKEALALALSEKKPAPSPEPASHGEEIPVHTSTSEKPRERESPARAISNTPLPQAASQKVPVAQPPFPERRGRGRPRKDEFSPTFPERPHSRASLSGGRKNGTAPFVPPPPPPPYPPEVPEDVLKKILE